MKFLIGAFLLAVCHVVYPQGYDGTPCTSGSPLLKNLLQKKELEEWRILECGGPNTNPFADATSFLKASGKAPVSEKDPHFKRPVDWEGDFAYDRWTCMYAAGSAIDGNNATAWVEGVPGSGKGELLLLTGLDLSRKIEILGGFGKNQTLFTANNRLKSINLHVVKATPMGGNSAQCETYRFESLTLIASMNLNLRDMNQFQALPIPSFRKVKFKRDGEELDYSYWLMLEIIDVYRGTKYDDTCISEIRYVK